MAEVVGQHGHPVLPQAKAAPAPEPKAPPAQPPAQAKAKGKARARPRIDIDNKIDEAKQAIVAAKRAMSQAKQQQKNERRKKQRLTLKAAQLSPQDLERIAVLKRTGLVRPAEAIQALEAQPEEAVPNQGMNMDAPDQPGAAENPEEGAGSPVYNGNGESGASSESERQEEAQHLDELPLDVQPEGEP